MKNQEMSEIERHLVFKIAGNIEKNLGYIYSLRCVSKNYFQILMYCDKKNIIGYTFSEIFEEHQLSPVRVMSYFLRKINMDQNRRASIKDLR